MLAKYPWYDEFLKHGRFSPVVKMVYVAACLEPSSATAIAKTMAMARSTVEVCVKTLVDAGWVVKRRHGRCVLILPTAPAQVQARYAKQLKEDLKMAVHLGEAIMKIIVSQVQVSRDVLDNVRPDCLRSPTSGFNLEVDRMVRNEAFWEYRGAQHKGTTRRYPDQKKADDTWFNDVLKHGLSAMMDLPLVVVYKQDLTVEGIQKLVPAGVKTWPLVDGPYLEAIREICRDYQAMDTGEESLPGSSRSQAAEEASRIAAQKDRRAKLQSG